MLKSADDLARADAFWRSIIALLSIQSMWH